MLSSWRWREVAYLLTSAEPQSASGQEAGKVHTGRKRSISLHENSYIFGFFRYHYIYFGRFFFPLRQLSASRTHGHEGSGIRLPTRHWPTQWKERGNEREIGNRSFDACFHFISFFFCAFCL